MAKTKDVQAARGLGERLSALHEEADRPAYSRIAGGLILRMGLDDAPKEIQVRRAHHGEIDPTTCAYELLAGLAAFYGRDVDDLGPTAARRAEVIDGLRTGSREALVAA